MLGYPAEWAVEGLAGIVSSRFRGVVGAVSSRHWRAYRLVGVTSVGVDLGLLVLRRARAGAPLWAAATVGFWSSVVVNCTLNRTVSFRDRRGGPTALARFGVLLGVNWLLTLVGVTARVHLGWPYTVGKVGIMPLLTVLDYTACSRWVFAEQPGRTAVGRTVGGGKSVAAVDFDGRQ